MKKKEQKDNYTWLEKNSKKANDWIDSQSKKTFEYFSGAKIRSKYKKRFEEIFDAESERIPSIRNGSYFFRKKLKGEEEPSIYFKTGIKGRESKLFDPRKFNYGSIQDWNVSDDGHLIQISFSKASNDSHIIKIFDTSTLSFLEDTLTSERYPYFQAWDSDSTGFWYVRGEKGHLKSDEKYYKKIYYHTLGQPIESDVTYFDKKLKKDDWPTFWRSSDGKYELVTVHHANEMTTIHFKNKNQTKATFENIVPGINAISYARAEGGYIYMNTNHNAPNCKILRRKILQNSLGKWEVFMPESKYKLESWILQDNNLVLEYIEDVSSKLYLVDLKTRSKKEIVLPALGSIDSYSTEYGGRELFFVFSSLATPVAIYKLDLGTGKYKLYWKADIGSKSNFEVKQEWVKSDDGTNIPIFILKKRNTKSNSPTLVSAYGGFGISEMPSYRAAVIPFVENGGVFVSANIRGGGEFGENWHKNTIKNKIHKRFEDFSSVLKYLVSKEYTSPDKLAIWGGSNGGLLMSVILLRYPNLFKAALIDVAVTDMLKFHDFDGGRWWISEYGDPDNAKMKKYLLSYSPYHNVENLRYPSALLMTGRYDDRVHPMHTYKFFAKLKENKNQTNPILLRVEDSAGHSGSSKTSAAVKKYSDIFTFLDKELND